MDVLEYTNLKITGNISVEPVTQKLPDDMLVYILLGPTGAGKSCFIQALAGDSQDLGISKDQLAGFTQTESVYKIVHVFFQDEGKDLPIFLVDTPGFSDPKISHVAVFATLGNLATELGRGKRPHKLLFLTPVTDTRMPGTKRRTVEMFTAMYEPSKYSFPLTIVTTMWNNLYTERARHRAEENHAQIRDDIWKAWLSISISRLTSYATHKFRTGIQRHGCNDCSIHQYPGFCLEILDTGPWNSDGVLNSVVGKVFFYGDLQERIESALQQKEIISSELAHPQAQTNLELRVILTKNYRENEETLKKFVEEFLDPEFPPAGFEDAHYRLLKSLLGTYIPLTTSMRIFVLRHQLTRLVRNAKRRGSKWFKPNA